MSINLPLLAFVGRIVCACCSIAIASALVGCSPNDGYPKDWQPVATASADQCPDITGTFAIDDKPAYHMLGGHYENNPRVWSVMSIAGNPQVGLQVALYEVGSGAPYEQPIKHNRGSDYQCSDGWLELEWPAGSIPMRSEDDRVPADDLMNKTLSLAKNSAGDLVIRTNVSHWKGFPVWCGDGCKYIPIPFTRETYYTWSRWLPVPIPTYRPPTANPEKYDFDAEAPADESPSGRLLRLLRSTAPLGIRVIDAKPEGDHWVVRVLGDNNTLIDFHQELLSSNAFEVMRLQPGDRRSNGERTMDVTLRVSPDKLARDAKAEAEQTRIQEGKARQDKEAQLIKLLLPSFPKDMVTTAYSLSAEGFLVEVRHKDEDAFYQLIVNAQSSGHFSEAKIKAQKYVDGYGRQVVDVLLKPMQR